MLSKVFDLIPIVRVGIQVWWSAEGLGGSGAATDSQMHGIDLKAQLAVKNVTKLGSPSPSQRILEALVIHS